MHIQNGFKESYTQEINNKYTQNATHVEEEVWIKTRFYTPDWRKSKSKSKKKKPQICATTVQREITELIDQLNANKQPT